MWLVPCPLAKWHWGLRPNLCSVINRAGIYYWSASVWGLLADLLTPVLFSNENFLHVCSPRKQFGNLTWFQVSLQTSPHWQPWSHPLPPPSPAPSRFIKRFCQSSGTFWANPADLWVCGQSTRELQLRSGEPGWVRLSFALSVLSEFPASELSQWMPIFPEKCNQPRFLHLKALFCAHTKRQNFQQPWIQPTEFFNKK